MVALRLGPLSYELVGARPRFLDPYLVAGVGARRVEVAVGEGETPVRDASVTVEAARHRVFLRPGADPERSLHAPLAELAARDLPEHGALLLHASAVRVAGGVALLVGPPSVGKTTFARHDPSRAFAGNAACARRVGGRWRAEALPFASDPDPDLDARGAETLVAVVELRRGVEGFEWIPPARATGLIMRRIGATTLDDPWRRERALAALDLAASVALASLGVAGRASDLERLDRSLLASQRP
ncbi:MAG: hypothetical protein R3A48_15590 [Polyangiales bacterium]